MFYVLTYHSSVIHPGAELEVADLVVEGEVLDVDGAGGSELGGRGPEHVAYGPSRQVSWCIISMKVK